MEKQRTGWDRNHLHPVKVALREHTRKQSLVNVKVVRLGNGRSEMLLTEWRSATIVLTERGGLQTAFFFCFHLSRKLVVSSVQLESMPWEAWNVRRVPRVIIKTKPLQVSARHVPPEDKFIQIIQTVTKYA